MKCADEEAVRCCGASASFVVGKPKAASEAPKEETAPLPDTQPDILSRTNVGDDQENEISDTESESVKMLSVPSETAEILGVEESRNIGNFHIKHLNGETDEEAAESESVIKTADVESGPVAVPLGSHRQPKNLDGVMRVYPNIMSGIPKTTPKNLPETNEVKVFDQEMGMDLHLVFSETTIKPEPTEEVPPSSTVESTSKQPLYRFAKRRRQFKPIQRATTTEKVSTTESSEDESKPTTVRSHTRQRVRNFTTRPPVSQEPPKTTTRRPRVTLATTASPTTQEKEILVTSEDDKSQSSRFRLFNARRMNYLRRSSTTIATTESSTETTTHRTTPSKLLVKKQPAKVVEKPQIRTRTRPSKMDENLIRVMDSDHENMISTVRDALLVTTTAYKVTEIPRSFASVDIGNRVKKIEEMLSEKMVNAYAETKAKLRSDQERKEVIDVQNDSKPTKAETSGQRNNSVRPFRGNKKFQISDLLDKTPVVTVSPNEFRRFMRRRRPTVKPEQEVTDDILPTTRRPHRRPTIKYQEASDESKTNIRDASSSEKNDDRNVRRRVTIRRRYRVDPSVTTTSAAPVYDSSDSQSEVTSSTISPNIPIKTTTFAPETTIPTETTPTTLPEEVEKDTESDVTDESVDVAQDNVSKDIVQDEIEDAADESVQNVDINEGSASSSENLSSNSDPPADFKPSPLWSISSDEKDEFIVKEDNHSYVMNMDERERAFRKKNRHTRSTFEPAVHYLNGFVPSGPIKLIGPIPKSSKLVDDAILRYNLPRGSKANFGKY